MAFCGHCGKELSAQAYSCPDCGHPQRAHPGATRSNSNAILALVLSIVGIFTCPIASIAGIIIGDKAKKEIAETGEQGEGMAQAAVVIGWVIIGLWVLGALVVFGGAAAFA